MNADSALRALVAAKADELHDIGLKFHEFGGDIAVAEGAVYRNVASELRSILSAPQAAPAGMVLVPREPTEAIRNSIYMALHYDMSVMNPDEWGAVDKAYAAMITAAPQPSDTTTPSGWKLNPSHDGGLIVSGPIGGCVVFADKGRIAERVLHSLATAMLAAAPAAGMDPPVDQQRDTLAKAIRDAAVKAGIARADAPMTGPMLLMLCDDLANAALTAAQVTTPFAWYRPSDDADEEPEFRTSTPPDGHGWIPVPGAAAQVAECGACGDGCKDRGACRVDSESPSAAPAVVVDDAMIDAALFCTPRGGFMDEDLAMPIDFMGLGQPEKLPLARQVMGAALAAALNQGKANG